MAEEAEAGSKTEAPTQKRLADARAKGDVAKSPDVSSFATLAGASLLILTLGGFAARQTVDRLRPFLEHPDAIDVSGGGQLGVLAAALRAAEPAFWVLGAAALAAVAGNVLQQGFIWAPGRLVPDASRVSLPSGLKRVFGIDGLIHFGKSVLKISAIGAVAVAILKPRADVLASLPALNIAAILPFAADAFQALLLAVLVVLAVIALADFMVQRQRFLQRLRMTKEELKEDTRQNEGDPHVKAKLRVLRMRRARTRMIQAVPKATMVVMNPTHYAVALRYVQAETAAPICVAKGLDALALRIREVAEANDIPVVEDPPLARALFAAMDVDETIPREHYQAVAKLIGFVMGQAQRRAAPPRPARL